MHRATTAIALALSLSGCASLSNGRDQTVLVNSKPTGAACEFMRGETIVATVWQTPQSISLQKSEHPLEVRCRKSGIGNAVSVLPARLVVHSSGILMSDGLANFVAESVSGSPTYAYPREFLVTFPGDGEPTPDIEPEKKERPNQETPPGAIVASRRVTDGQPVPPPESGPNGLRKAAQPEPAPPLETGRTLATQAR